jgi:hypothetical protein
VIKIYEVDEKPAALKGHGFIRANESHLKEFGL